VARFRVGRAMQSVVNHRDMQMAARILRVCEAVDGEGQ
jgi:hypothetical protein